MTGQNNRERIQISKRLNLCKKQGDCKAGQRIISDLRVNQLRDLPDSSDQKTDMIAKQDLSQSVEQNGNESTAEQMRQAQETTVNSQKKPLISVKSETFKEDFKTAIMEHSKVLIQRLKDRNN